MARTPLPVPLSGVEGAVFPAPVGGMQAVMLAALQQLEHTQYLPADAMLARQFRQIALTARHAQGALPFWRERFRAAGFDPAAPITPERWAALPILTRAEAIAAGAALHCSALPAQHGGVESYATSGSTGMTLAVRRSALASFYWQVFTLREEIWQGRDFAGKFAAIRPDDTRAPAAMTGLHERARDDWGPPVASVYPSGPSVLLDVRCSIAEQVAWLQRQAPQHLLSFATNLLHLARHCIAHGIALPSLQTVRSSGEVLSDTVRETCRAAWGVAVADIYSAVETGYLGLQCPEHPHLHVQSESALVEILDDDGRPCLPGQVGRVVVTPLHNFAMPLFRYALDDRAEVGAACPCGRTLPVIARVQGRVHDVLVLPSGERRLLHYSSRVFAGFPAILQHQLVQKTVDGLELRLVARTPLSPDDETTLRTAIQRELGHPFAISFVYCDALARTASGKFAEFRSEITGPKG